MIYKYTKCESVIAKIMADAGIEDIHLRVTDIKEWIFEAIEKIGAPVQYITRESGVDCCPILKICDNQVPLPDDLVHLSTVAYARDKKGPWCPVRVNNQSFREEPRPCCNKPSEETKEAYMYDVPCIHNEEHEDNFVNKPITMNHQLYGINGMKYLAKRVEDGSEEDPQYFIKPGWLVINRKEGYIRLSYKAIATDEKGYPLIPDLPSYQEAIYWYVLMKLHFPRFLKVNFGKGNAVRAGMEMYYYLQREWCFYRGQAYAEAMMPNESEMINIKNEWNKLIPEWDGDEVFFKTSGEKQLNFHDYYYGY